MNDDPEIAALTSVYAALKGLDADAQQRVIEYVSKKLRLEQFEKPENSLTPPPPAGRGAASEFESEAHEERVDENRIDDDGISPVALKWMRRSGLTPEQLSKVFSLGAEEIDFVANSVPGGSKRARTRSVTLLKGMAAYLSSGAARVTAEQIKEACLHYDAYDSPNHAKYLKDMAAELSGNKSSGFVLTPRGLTAGTDMIKKVLGIATDT